MRSLSGIQTASAGWSWNKIWDKSRARGRAAILQRPTSRARTSGPTSIQKRARKRLPRQASRAAKTRWRAPVRNGETSEREELTLREERRFRLFRETNEAAGVRDGSARAHNPLQKCPMRIASRILTNLLALQCFARWPPGICSAR